MTGIREDDDLFDEGRLRRALRLDAAELPRRLDASGFAAGACAADRPPALAAIASTIVAGTAGAFLVSLIAVAVPSLGPAFVSDLWSAVLSTVARVAVPVSGVLAVAQEPAVPMSTLAILAVAIVFEYAQRRERLRAATS
jgi:hypothetical protein